MCQWLPHLKILGYRLYLCNESKKRIPRTFTKQQPHVKFPHRHVLVGLWCLSTTIVCAVVTWKTRSGLQGEPVVPSSWRVDYYTGLGPQGFSWWEQALGPCNYGWRNGCSVKYCNWWGGIVVKAQKTLPDISFSPGKTWLLQCISLPRVPWPTFVFSEPENTNTLSFIASFPT